MFLRARALLVFTILLMPLCAPEGAKGENLVKTAFSLEGRYDTNSQVDIKGKQSGDTMLTFSPSIELVNTGKSVVTNLNYGLSARYFFKNPEQNYLTHSASVGISAKLSDKTSLSAGDKFTFSPDAFSFTDISQLQIQRKRSDTLYNNAFIGLSHSPTSKTTVSLSLSDSLLDFTDPSLIDTRTDSASLSGSYAMTAETSVRASYSYSKTTFDTANATNFEIHSLTAGFSNRPTPTITLDLYGGAVYTPRVGSKYDWVAGATIVKTFKESSATLGYSRSVSNSAGLSTQVNVNNTFSAGWGTKLSDTVKLNLSGSYSENRSKPSAIVDAKSYSAGVSTSWQYNSWVSFAFGYSHFQQWGSRESSSLTVIGDSVYATISATPYEGRF